MELESETGSYMREGDQEERPVDIWGKISGTGSCKYKCLERGYVFEITERQ